MLDYLSRTMLIERLCGVFVYALALMIAYYSVKRARSYRKLNRILNTYLVILTVMGFFYIPSSSADLYRWLRMTRNWYKLSFGEFLEGQMIKSSYPVGLLMIYLCQKTRIEGVLPAVCSFLFHKSIFDIIKMQYRRQECSARDLALSMLLFMSAGRFLEAISGVRCLVALSILARQFCEEFLDQKIRFRNLFWEFLAALIHPMALVLWAIRLAFLLVQRAGTNWGRIVNICISAVMILLGFRYGGTYIENATDKAIGYLEGGTYSYSWGYLLSGLVLTSLIYSIYYAYQLGKNKGYVRWKNIISFNVLLILLSIACLYEYTIFYRTVMFTSIMMMPVISYVSTNTSSKRYRVVVFCLSLITLLLACARGELCGYKFFVISW